MKFDNIDEVIKLIKRNQSVPDWIKEAREDHRDLKGLVYGDDYKELILRIEHIETAKKAVARKKYSRPIKDINTKILNPVNNIYSATGGSKEYSISSMDAKNAFIRRLSNVRDGYSIERWLNTFWSKDLYVVDPNGLIFVEYKTEPEIKAYPTYKSIDVIRNYQANGLHCEWILFEPKQLDQSGDKYWRIVDDSRDWIIKQSGDAYAEITDTEAKHHSFDHPFGKVPAQINSDIQRLGKKKRYSPLDDIIETEKEFMRDRSILTIHKFLNGFSIPYRPALVCPTCHGTKKNGDGDCNDCDGKGFLQGADVVDEIILPIDMNAETQPTLPTNFAGFISPDLEIWNQYRKEQKTMFGEMFEAIWGTRESEEVKDQTAMGQILNLQPMEARLGSWSNVAESQEKGITELLANIYIPTKEKTEEISQIFYGRNYIIQPPSFLLKEYHESVEKKDSLTVRDRKLNEYLTAKYKNNPESLRLQLLKKELEPYVHYDIELVAKIYGNTEARKKGLFIDWWETLTEQDKTKTKEVLEQMRDVWFDEQLLKLTPEQSGTNINQNQDQDE